MQNPKKNKNNCFHHIHQKHEIYTSNQLPKKKKKNPKTLIKEKANTIELCKTDYQSIEIGKAIIQSGCLS